MSEKNVNLLIESILDRRQGRGAYQGRGRLQEIEDRIKNLKEARVKFTEFMDLVRSINVEIESESGPYFTMFSKDPEALAKLKLIRCGKKKGDSEAEQKITETIAELEKLRKRFEREALRIAFVGRERQGKSTFLKTITGLNDKIIPAYSGNSCTGAVSVIHNCKNPKLKNGTSVKVLVKVQYYDEVEMLSIVNGKLKKFFPSGIYQIGRLDQIPTLALPEMPEITGVSKINDEFIKFKETTIDQYRIYSSLIGAGVQEYSDENVIAEHVAQYEEFDHEVPNAIRCERGKSYYWKKCYYKYLAVKSVDIYTSFNIEATEKLELVDTIGIGSSSDTKEIEEEMYRVLKEDCDAAINLFRPEITGAIPEEQDNILDKIKERLDSRNPSKWIGYVVNKVTGGPFINFPGGATTAFESLFKSKQINPKSPMAWVKLIDGNDFQDVSDNLVVPLLTLVSENLNLLDQQLTEKVEMLSKQAYAKCLEVVKDSRSVISSDISKNANSLALFDAKLYKNMLNSFGVAMNVIDIKGYAKHQDEPCPALTAKYEEIMESIGSMIPKKAMILKRFQSEMGLTEVRAFEDYIEQLRNDIFEAYENVNVSVLYPLQEEVKLNMIKVLYEEGQLKKLPVPVKSPTCEWLRSVIDNYVDENTYPNFRKALEFILNYRLNIEGMIEYNVAKSLEIIEPTNKNFISYPSDLHGADFEESADNVWQELRSRCKPVKGKLAEWATTFSAIPSHSFYSRVHKFHLKVMSDKKGREEFRSFYRDNMSLIWPEEIINAGIAQKAFGEWNERAMALQQCINTTAFNIE